MYHNVESLMEDFAILFDFWKEGETSEEEVKEAFDKATAAIDEAEFKSTLNEPTDDLPAVLQINSGAGGTESQDWAEMLARMYRMYGEKQGWSVSELDWQWGDGAGIKTCTFQLLKIHTQTDRQTEMYRFLYLHHRPIANRVR